MKQVSYLRDQMFKAQFRWIDQLELVLNVAHLRFGRQTSIVVVVFRPHITIGRRAGARIEQVQKRVHIDHGYLLSTDLRRLRLNANGNHFTATMIVCDDAAPRHCRRPVAVIIKCQNDQRLCPILRAKTVRCPSIVSGAFGTRQQVYL